MYSFFQYTPVVNYGSEIDYAALPHNNIRIDDRVWEDDGSLIDDGGWRNIGCGMDKCGKLSASFLYTVYPLQPETIITESRDEEGRGVNIGLE